VAHDSRPNDVAWPGARWIEIDDLRLTRGEVTLRAARADDAAGLFAVDDSDECWRHVAGRPSSPDDLVRIVDGARVLGRHMWVVLRGNAIVGTTSFLDVSVIDARVEIGSTMYARSEWGSNLNTVCKLLLMSHAFDALGMGRVQLKTDVRNMRSRAAIEKIGATREGVLRRYQRRADGTVRDTVMYSVVAEEWPVVREKLNSRLG